MKEIQKIQPLVKSVQKKHKGDKQKQHEALMELYKEHNFRPLGGCLPLILQIPIFFALFRVLMGDGKTGAMAIVAAGLSGEPFLGLALNQTAWSVIQAKLLGGALSMQGIIIALPYIILIAIMAVSQWWMNKTMGSQDPQQNRMMNMMFLFLIVIGFTLPTGVLLYWTTTNILTAAQQALTFKYLSNEEPAKS